MLNTDKLTELYNLVKGVDPVNSVEFGTNGEFHINFDDNATDQQRSDANNIAQELYQDSVEPIEPDWAAFRSALRINPEWKRVLSADMVDAAVLTSTLWQATFNPQLFVEVVELWNSLVSVLSPPITSAEIDTINGLSSASNIPLLLDDDGTMQILM